MGLFVSIEGADGSGKGTQARMLLEWALKEGFDARLESFPRHGTAANEPIKKYLNGDFGTDVHPILASIPYAIDRHLATPEIQQYRDNPNGMYIADRFDDSNDGHQGSKYKTREEKIAFFEYQKAYEHGALGVPEPDITILLLVPVEIAQKNVDKKAARNYTDKKRDIHEADASHLQGAYETFVLLAELQPKRIKVVNPMEDDGKTMRSLEAIHEDIKQLVSNRLTLTD